MSNCTVLVTYYVRSPFYYNENLQKVLIAPNGFNTRMVRDIYHGTLGHH